MAKKPKDPRLGGDTVNEILQALTIRHGVSIEKLKGSEVRKLLDLLAEADAELLDTIDARLIRLGPLELQRFGFGKATTERAIKLREAIDEIASRSFEVVNTGLAASMFDTGKAEFAFQASAIGATIALKTDFITPSNTLLRTLIRARPFSGAFGSSRLLSEYARAWSAGKRDAVTGVVRNALITGQTIPQARRRIQDVLDNSRIGAERIARTAIAHVTSAARQATYEQNADVLKGVKWVATLDSRTCPVCAALDGKVFPISSGPRPPAHWSCFQGDTPVTPCGEIMSISKRPFKGDLIVICTAAGRHISCTPNHLIATRRGWIAAKSIEAGDQVIGDGGSERMGAIYDKREHRKPRLHDIAESFRRSHNAVAEKMPTAAPDFHGDGIDGEIGVIWSYRCLPTKRDACGYDAVRVHRDNPGDHASCGLHPTPMLSGKSGGPQDYGAFFGDTVDGFVADAESFTNRLRRVAAEVEFDDVVSVGVQKDVFCDVFNLETEKNVYFAGGILAHNCRCVMTPVVKFNAGFPKGERASSVGPVPGDVTFGEWLRSQPIATQNDVLGKTKAELFRKGGVDLDGFIDRSGKEFTLDDLARSNAAAFKRAGLK